MQVKRYFAVCILLFPLMTQKLFAEDLTAQRHIFNRAEHALKKNDFLNYERLAQQITSYPLYPYLRYDSLKKWIDKTPPNASILADIQQFAEKYPDFPFTSTLYHLALEKIPEKKQPSLFLQAYQEYQAFRTKEKTGKIEKSEKENLKCRYSLANYYLTTDPKYLQQAEPLWLVGYSHSLACDQLFSTWDKVTGITTILYWNRFKLALENRNFPLVEHLIKHLSKEDRILALTLVEIVKKPQLIMKESYLNDLTLSPSQQAEVVTQGLRIYAKNDAASAYKWWDRHQSDYPFSDEQSRILQRDLAVALSQQKIPMARHWLGELAETVLDTTAKEWRVRLALAEHDWANVLQWIHRLPQERIHSDWHYWQARALEALHQPGSTAIYQELTKTRNYYGFLASLRLKQSISVHHQPLKIEPLILEQVKQLPAIQRFFELQLIGKTAPARVEWFRAADKMSEPQLLALAHIANEMELYDIAILTLAKTQAKNDMSIRFPLAHKEEILTLAHLHNLDPAWIYAIIRQESAFFNDSLSPAGARGLMQLMPSTAEILSKKFDIPYDSESALHQTHTNIQLGSVYLKNLKERMQNHLILATASYNAGPKHIYRWLPEQPLEADIWIETMPFGETREYVKNVIAFTSIYRQRLGYPVALNLMMKPIPSKPFN